MARPLKLRAEDNEDFTVLRPSSRTRSSLFGEMAYLPEEQRFVLVANRFRGNADHLEAAGFRARAYAVTIDGVGRTKYAASTQGARPHLPLLAITVCATAR